MPIRLLVIAFVFAGVAAISVPKLAPDVLAALLNRPAPDRVADAPSRAATEAPKARKAPLRSVNSRRMILEADRFGHFQVDASINGRPAEAMVDTGATVVALSAESARKIGIVPARSAYTTPISTANGVVAAASVTLNDVRVGGIRVRNVAAVVVPDGLLSVNLLGMSFLSRLSKFELSGPRLVLVQ